MTSDKLAVLLDDEASETQSLNSTKIMDMQVRIDDKGLRSRGGRHSKQSPDSSTSSSKRRRKNEQLRKLLNDVKNDTDSNHEIPQKDNSVQMPNEFIEMQKRLHQLEQRILTH
jgi:hypothetical protein